MLSHRSLSWITAWKRPASTAHTQREQLLVGMKNSSVVSTCVHGHGLVLNKLYWKAWVMTMCSTARSWPVTIWWLSIPQISPEPLSCAAVQCQICQLLKNAFSFLCNVLHVPKWLNRDQPINGHSDSAGGCLINRNLASSFFFFPSLPGIRRTLLKFGSFCYRFHCCKQDPLHICATGERAHTSLEGSSMAFIEKTINGPTLLQFLFLLFSHFTHQIIHKVAWKAATVQYAQMLQWTNEDCWKRREKPRFEFQISASTKAALGRLATISLVSPLFSSSLS